MRKIAALASLAAALFAAEAKSSEQSEGRLGAVATEAGDSYERDDMISAEAGYQENNLQNGYDFTEGWQAEFSGNGAINIYTDMQLEIDGNVDMNFTSYSDGCGKNRQVSIGASALLEWAPRWETAAFNLGAGVHFNFIGDYASYENVQLESQIIGAGPALEAFVGSEWVYAGLNFSTAFGEMGNNVQQYNDLVQYNLALKLGFHLGPVDIEAYASGRYNTAMEGQLNRENIFVSTGANARVWVAENFGLTAGYGYLWTYGDTDHIEGNKFNAGIAVRF